MAKTKLSGHICMVCGERMASEKFSGKGQIAHICRDCAKLPQVERATAQTLRTIEGMAGRQIDGTEIEWLLGCLRDPRCEVQRAAHKMYHMKFQRYERVQIKEGLTVDSLEFYLHGEVWSESGDIPVHVRITADQNGTIKLIDYTAKETERETQVDIDQPVARRFLKMLIHEWDILFWDEDLSDLKPNEDPYLETLEELIFASDRGKDEDVPDENGEAAQPGEPLWCVKLELNSGTSKEITFYNQLQSEPQEMYWALTNFFEPKEPYKKGLQQVWL